MHLDYDFPSQAWSPERRGTYNVLRRLCYLWRQTYLVGEPPIARMIADWQLARGQGARWLSEDIEATIMAWNRPYNDYRY